MEDLYCGVCGGFKFLLGFMGNLAWYRCGNCGMESCSGAELEEYELDEDE